MIEITPLLFLFGLLLGLLGPIVYIVAVYAYIVAVSRACAEARAIKPLYIWLAAIPLWCFNQAVTGPLILEPIFGLAPIFGLLGILFVDSQLWQALLVYFLIRILRSSRKEADSTADVGES
jgi:hypothetical protein